MRSAGSTRRSRQYDQVIAERLRRCSRAARGSARPKRSCAPGSSTRRSPRFKQIVEQKDAPLPAEAMLMELARAYKLAGKTDDARKTLTQIVEQHADSQYATEREEPESCKD